MLVLNWPSRGKVGRLNVVESRNCFLRWNSNGKIVGRIWWTISWMWKIVGFLISSIGMPIVKVVLDHEGHWTKDRNLKI